MSKQLPAKPNLENLKKQAKTLLKAQRDGEIQAAERIKAHLPRLAHVPPEDILKSDFTLQEAQLVVTREYGFPSWPQLVEMVSNTKRHALFTSQVKAVMAYAKEEAQRLDRNHIGTEHLLLGIIKDGRGKPVTILDKLGLDLDTLKQAIEDFVDTSDNATTSGELPFTPRAKGILENAVREAEERNHNFVDGEHLLLALRKDQDDVSAQIL
jgi:hypothetical protein